MAEWMAFTSFYSAASAHGELRGLYSTNNLLSTDSPACQAPGGRGLRLFACMFTAVPTEPAVVTEPAGVTEPAVVTVLPAPPPAAP